MAADTGVRQTITASAAAIAIAPSAIARDSGAGSVNSGNSSAADITSTASGVVMAIEHRTLPLAGVQFHPEAVLTEGTGQRRHPSSGRGDC